MNKTDTNQSAQATRHQPQASTTLNRKYVKRPNMTTKTIPKQVSQTVQIRHNMQDLQQSSKISRSINISRYNMEQSSAKQQPQIQQSRAQSINQQPTQSKLQKAYLAKIATKQQQSQQPRKMTAKEIKDQAIAKALKNAQKNSTIQQPTQPVKTHFGIGRIMLALGCAAAAVFAIIYFVNLSMPDISLRVVAMQSGIDITYPSYVPRDFTLSDIASGNNSVTLNFKNASTGDAFSISEEESSWNSEDLLANFVKDSYNSDYSLVREQGLTLYIDGSNACWVNGGFVYKLTTLSGSLTKKQIRSIATSL